MFKRLKIIDRLVLKAFIGPYMLSFFIAQFVLVMQFLWKHIDDILGKGFSVIDLIELISYFAVTQIPMALPIAVLLSSVMVMGNMSERYELSSMKSAGVSLIRIIRAAIILAIATSILSLLASNYFKPQANFQFKKRMLVIKSQKPSLALEAKIFNRDFNGYSIRVNEKGKNDDSIKDVYIYDHTMNDKSLVSLTKADYGRMYNDEKGGYFIMELNDGTSYREMKREAKKGETGKSYPFMRTDFKEWKKVFDLSEFDTDDDNSISINRSKEDMLNTFQLLDALDSVEMKKSNLIALVIEDNRKGFGTILANNQGDQDTSSRGFSITKMPTKKADDRRREQLRDKIKRVPKNRILPIQNALKRIVDQKQIDTLSNYTNWHETISAEDNNNLHVKAVQSSSKRKDLLRNATTNISALNYKRDLYLLRLNQQYSFAAICIIFLFIGAPLGSIIRKGGYGYPLLFAILFYMLFIITTIMGEKLVRSQSIHPIMAAWLANIIVSPVAIWLTFKALRDSKFEGFGWLIRIIAFFKTSKLTKLPI